MTRNLKLVASIVFLGCGLGACSASPDMQTGSALAPAEQSGAPVQVAAQTSPPAYQLNEKELKLSCKALIGTIKIRLLQMNAAGTTADGTLVARGMQAGAVKVFGGPTYGTDPSGEAARDRAQLEAYNQQLVAKKCKPLDLQAETQAAAATPKVQ